MDLVLISPVSPYDPCDGHRLAVASDVHAAADSGLQVGVIHFAYENERSPADPPFPTTSIAALGGGFPARLLRSFWKSLPPSAERLYSASAYAEIRRSLLGWKPPVVVIDDASVGGYIPLIRELLPKTKIVLRSHNVMHDVRREQLSRIRGMTRPAVEFDCGRYIAFERKAVQAADAHWAITEADAARMGELYGVSAQCLTVSVPIERYRELRADHGCGNRFVHVGTLDFRRRSDLSSFLLDRWPKVLAIDAVASLTLAGSLYGETIPSPNVTYAGRVASDVDVYRTGRFALNFQSSTGGVKLKTLTSLAAGRLLISTAQGVEGLPLQSKRHYWDLDGLFEHQNLKDVLQDPRATLPIAEAGRQYVFDHHSRAAVARQFQHLLSLL